MQITRILLGMTNCYLVRGTAGYILIDAGVPRQGNNFKRKLHILNIPPSDIKLIIITHAHYDHVGSLAVIKELCDCPVLLHPWEAEIVEKGLVTVPPGTNWWGSFISGLGRRFYKPFMAFPATKPDILAEDNYRLDEYGVSGRLLFTPGHTPGSLTVLLDDGRALVGDLFTNFPFSNSFFPPFAEEPKLIRKMWTLVKDLGAKIIYPAHGSSFPINRAV